jgi:DNA-binding CsgD family transcriptional regulator
VKSLAATQPLEPDSNGPDSFDDDLLWILQRLTERTGARFGVFVRFVEGVREPLILATHDPGGGLTAATGRDIANSLRTPLPAERAAAEQILHRRDLEDVAAAGGLRVMYMRFPLASGVSVIAFVGQPATSLSLLQDLVAQRLHPVLQRYLRLWWLHRSERRRAQGLAAAADRSDVALALLDRRCKLSFANAAAERLLAQGDGLRRQGTGLTSTQPGDAVRLQAVLQHAMHCNAVGSSLSDYHAPVVALRRANRRPLLLLAMPLQRTAMDPDDPAVIIHALDPEAETPQQLSPIFRLYQLTATEARLVSHLVHGLSLSESAVAMKVGIPTARGYLKRIFMKTDTNRQGELIRLVLASAVRSSIGLDLGLM